jgi:dipeptidyl aminopeptidase/acylaminoacyl peptidase
VKARDGTTDLYGLLYRPTNFDPARKYPVIDRIYPGPQIGSVGKFGFQAARGDSQAMAELGFVVVAIDGMGTSLRSKRFQDAYGGNLSDDTLPDQVAGIRELARRYPWIDLTRVGIYGHSGGAYAAVGAMLRYPEFFKVGVAESGNYDQRGYEADWGEQYIGLREPGPDAANYDAQDEVRLAGNLQGHLLLMDGTTDDNVPPYLTNLLLQALIGANKDFDLVMLPNQRHMYRGAARLYAARRRWDYYVRYLLGDRPPREYALHPPAGAPLGYDW